MVLTARRPSATTERGRAVDGEVEAAEEDEVVELAEEGGVEMDVVVGLEEMVLREFSKWESILRG